MLSLRDYQPIDNTNQATSGISLDVPARAIVKASGKLLTHDVLNSIFYTKGGTSYSGSFRIFDIEVAGMSKQERSLVPKLGYDPDIRGFFKSNKSVSIMARVKMLRLTSNNETDIFSILDDTALGHLSNRGVKTISTWARIRLIAGVSMAAGFRILVLHKSDLELDDHLTRKIRELLEHHAKPHLSILYIE